MSQIYKDNHETLEGLLDQAGSAQGASLLIPDLQRPYVWSPQQVIYLVDSLVRGWPFGSLLLWSVSEEDVAKMPSRQFSMVVARDHGTTDTVPQRMVPAHYRMVLDGQQRVQSLLLAFGGDGWGFKLEDRTWHEAVNSKRPRGRYYVRHWSMGELCVDLEKFAEEFARTQSLAALEFEKVLTWVVRDPQNGQSTWPKPKNYEEPLLRSVDHPGRFIRLSRLWFALRTGNPSLAQIRQATEEVLAEHGVADDLKERVQDAIMELIQTLQSVKATRVTFLEVNRYTGADMGTPESYSDAVVTIFTRLNTAGRTLTREEITFAWIKSGWDPSKTWNRGASDCFTQLRDELKREAKLDLDLDSLVAGVSIVWAVRYNGGKILANADLLKGDRVRPMAAEIAAEWHRISRSVLEVSRMVSERGYQYGRHYGSLNSLALMWAWWYAGAKWEASHALREVDRDAWAKCREDGLLLYLDRWLIASQWAGRWGGSSSATYLDNFCSALSVAAAGTDAIQTPKESVQVMADALGSLISAFASDANNFIETLEVESRNRVRGYYLALWIWHRLNKNRWSASSIPLRTRKKDGTLDVDHIVSVGLCSDYGYQTEPGDDEENIPPYRVNINAIGNCWLLETTFNIAKSKEPARDFLGKVIEFKDDPQALINWEGNIGLPPAMVAPDKDKPQETADAINQRTREIKDDLKKFVSGSLARVDLASNGDESASA
jgi:hypothetical protein